MNYILHHKNYELFIPIFLKMSRILRIKREQNWLGKFRIEYDGKYIALFGEDLNYPGWGYGTVEGEPTWYEVISRPSLLNLNKHELSLYINKWVKSVFPILPINPLPPAPYQ